MQYSKFDMFLDDVTIAASGSDDGVLENNFNRNFHDKMYLVVHTPATTGVNVTLATADTNTNSTTWTTLRSWSGATADDNGYVILEKFPKGLSNFIKLTVANASQSAAVKVRAGIVLEEDLDYDWGDRDPKAMFNGTKTISGIQAEIA